MFLTLLDFTNRFTVSILRMFWWELVRHMTNHSILKWGRTSSMGSSMYHHVKNNFFNVPRPNWRACWGGLTSSYGVSAIFALRYIKTVYSIQNLLGEAQQLVSRQSSRIGNIEQPIFVFPYMYNKYQVLNMELKGRKWYGKPLDFTLLNCCGKTKPHDRCDFKH